MDIVALRTVDSSLLDLLLLAAFLGSGRRLLVVFARAGDALLSTGLLGCSSNGSAASLDLTTSLLDLLEAVGERDLQAGYRGASEIGGSLIPVDLWLSAIVVCSGRRADLRCRPGDG